MIRSNSISMYYINLLCHSQSTGGYNTMLHFSYGEMILFNDKRGRKLLKNWCEDELDPYELNLLRAILSEELPQLLPAISASTCPREYSWIVREVCKPSPVTSLLPLDSLPIAETIVQHGSTLSPEQGRLLKQKSPFLYKIVVQQACEVPWVRELVMVMFNKAKLVDKPAHCLSAPPTDAGTSFFPNLPMVCARGRYDLDREPGPTPPACTKTAPGHGSLLPGVFTLHCQHSKYYM